MATKFKVTITDFVCYPCGTYGAETRTASHRSPKVTWDRVLRPTRNCHRTQTVDTPFGGTPVMRHVKMWLGSKVILNKWD